jgi:hypothetical protein
MPRLTRFDLAVEDATPFPLDAGLSQMAEAFWPFPLLRGEGSGMGVQTLRKASGNIAFGGSLVARIGRITPNPCPFPLQGGKGSVCAVALPLDGGRVGGAV